MREDGVRVVGVVHGDMNGGGWLVINGAGKDRERVRANQSNKSDKRFWVSGCCAVYAIGSGE